MDLGRAEVTSRIDAGGPRKIALGNEFRGSAYGPTAEFSPESCPSAAVGDSGDQGVRAAHAVLVRCEPSGVLDANALLPDHRQSARREERLSGLTFGDLFQIRSMGA